MSGKICVIYYSMYGHIKTMTDAFVVGVKEAGMEVDVFQCPELLPKDVLEKMGAPAQDESVPLMDHAAIATLPEYDGFAFGIPTRFGAAPFQVKAVFDSLGAHWSNGALAGKPATIFVSTGLAGFGQETTVLTTLPCLVHQGMIFVPPGSSSPEAFDVENVRGGGPWGAGSIAGPTGARQPSEVEKKMATTQGKIFGSTAAALKKGRA